MAPAHPVAVKLRLDYMDLHAHTGLSVRQGATTCMDRLGMETQPLLQLQVICCRENFFKASTHAPSLAWQHSGDGSG